MDEKERARSAIRDAIAAVNWEDWAQPKWNSRRTIPAELRNILEVSDEKSLWRAVEGTEYAFGNAEAGTYYPAVIPAIPILASIVQQGEECPRWAAIEILYDWLFTFYPEHRQGWVIDLEPACHRSAESGSRRNPESATDLREDREAYRSDQGAEKIHRRSSVGPRRRTIGGGCSGSCRALRPSTPSPRHPSIAASPPCRRCRRGCAGRRPPSCSNPGRRRPRSGCARRSSACGRGRGRC